MRVSAFITQLEARAGREWTDEEFAQVVAWWCESEQERLVWYCAARFLGKQATREDVEEAWLDFYAKILPRTRLSYRPGGPGFCTYLLDVCLKNHCLQERLRLDRRRRQEAAWAKDRSALEQMAEEQAFEQTETDPFHRAKQQAFLDALHAALNARTIRPLHREAFLLRYLEQHSYPDIGRALGVPEGTAKAWVHRVTARIAAQLQQQGWGE